MGQKLKLKRHESFLLREGWIPKYLNSTETHGNVFYKNDGIKILGIGSNMVKSLKFWLHSANIINADKNNSLTEFGKLLKQYDPYLETNFSISLIHYFLVRTISNGKPIEWMNVEMPVFSAFFNNFKDKTFTKDDVKKYLSNFFKEKDFEFNESSLDADVTILFRTYLNTDFDKNPEENYYSPLSKLSLMLQKDKIHYQKSHDTHLGIEPIVILYCLKELYKNKEFEIGDAFIMENSPVLIFNLDRNTFGNYLLHLQKDGYLTVNKTAGLDMVYFEGKAKKEKLKLKDLFEIYFGGIKNV